MAASIKRTIRRSLMEIIEGKNATAAATPAERLEACKLLLKELALAQKGKPRGKPFTRKAKEQTSPRIGSLSLSGIRLTDHPGQSPAGIPDERTGKAAARFSSLLIQEPQNKN